MNCCYFLFVPEGDNSQESEKSLTQISQTQNIEQQQQKIIVNQQTQQKQQQQINLQVTGNQVSQQKSSEIQTQKQNKIAILQRIGKKIMIINRLRKAGIKNPEKLLNGLNIESIKLVGKKGIKLGKQNINVIKQRSAKKIQKVARQVILKNKGKTKGISQELKKAISSNMLGSVGKNIVKDKSSPEAFKKIVKKVIQLNRSKSKEEQKFQPSQQQSTGKIESVKQINQQASYLLDRYGVTKDLQKIQDSVKNNKKEEEQKQQQTELETIKSEMKKRMTSLGGEPKEKDWLDKSLQNPEKKIEITMKDKSGKEFSLSVKLSDFLKMSQEGLQQIIEKEINKENEEKKSQQQQLEKSKELVDVGGALNNLADGIINEGLNLIAGKDVSVPDKIPDDLVKNALKEMLDMASYKPGEEIEQKPKTDNLDKLAKYAALGENGTHKQIAGQMAKQLEFLNLCKIGWQLGKDALSGKVFDFNKVGEHLEKRFGELNQNQQGEAQQNGINSAKELIGLMELDQIANLGRKFSEKKEFKFGDIKDTILQGLGAIQNVKEGLKKFSKGEKADEKSLQNNISTIQNEFGKNLNEEEKQEFSNIVKSISGEVQVQSLKGNQNQNIKQGGFVERLNIQEEAKSIAENANIQKDDGKTFVSQIGKQQSQSNNVLI